MQDILPSDSRPQTLYTQNPRPGKEHAVYPRHFTHTPFRTFALALSQPYTISYPHLILYLAAILYIFSDLLCIFPHRYNHLCTFCHLNNYRCHTSVPAQQPRLLPGSFRTQETAGAVIYRIWISVSARFCRNSVALPLFFYENGLFIFSPLHHQHRCQSRRRAAEHDQHSSESRRISCSRYGRCRCG